MKSLAHPAPTTTREERGLALYREHAAAIRFDAVERDWLVPSQHDSTSVYEVSIGRRGESCECRDHDIRGATCKHIVAATIAWAKTGRCGGCGGRFPRRDLFEVEEGHLTFFEGDELCRPCARCHGVL
jgi:SWIM zinc finger